MNKKADGNARTLELGKKLWKACEAPQGLSFVSDDMVEWPDGAVLEFLEKQIPNARKVLRIMERMAKTYTFADDE